MKQTNSFQRWKRRYFKLRGRTLYYAQTAKVCLHIFFISIFILIALCNGVVVISSLVEML